MTTKTTEQEIGEVISFLSSMRDWGGGMPSPWDTAKLQLLTIHKKHALKEYKRGKAEGLVQAKKIRPKKKKDPRKTKARRDVFNAVHSGKLKKLPCRVCGNENVQGHHEDYDKPLVVVWLCPRHHAIRDRRKTMVYKGKKYTYEQLTQLSEVGDSALRSRIGKRGWSVKKAVETGFAGNDRGENWRKKFCKPVVGTNIKTGEKKEYLSLTRAQFDTGADKTSISLCAKGKRLTTGGYTWRFK